MPERAARTGLKGIHPVVSGSWRADAGILGAGIMGCCLALELAQRGYRIDLIDLAPSPMTGASLHNEGKLHLGFVYAKDPLRATHVLMARGSLAFSRILHKLTGCGAEALVPSQPFHYYVPIDSQLDVAAIQRHFEAVEAAAQEMSRQSGDLYVGRRIDRTFERNTCSVHKGMFSPKLVMGSFRTEEVSVSPADVARILCRAIASDSRIRFLASTEVLGATRRAAGDVEVETRRGGEVAVSTYPCVANCLWEDRLKIDATAGVPHPEPWILRYKATIELPAPAAAPVAIPSATGILGPYGDVVNHGNGSYYVSWYPLCRLAQSVGGDGRTLRDEIHETTFSQSIRKAASKLPAVSRFVASVAHRNFIRNNISELAAYIPSVAGLLGTAGRRCVVSGGVILARGATDIDDPESTLHQRSAIGPAAYGSYVTIDTGKYCTAPLFAVQAADMISRILS
jgi:glycine/D-amino acid oxidase-like deaminating enzyme